LIATAFVPDLSTVLDTVLIINGLARGAHPYGETFDKPHDGFDPRSFSARTFSPAHAKMFSQCFAVPALS